MSFFSQLQPGPCQLVALQIALSFFEIYPSRQALKNQLPKHTFGNFITELGVYLEGQNIKTKLFSNLVPFKTNNQMFLQSLAEYKTHSKFLEKIPQQQDIKNKLVIINLDRHKVLQKKLKPRPHYIVIKEQAGNIWFYDCDDFSRRLSRDFSQFLLASQKINRYQENGMWLVLEPNHSLGS